MSSLNEELTFTHKEQHIKGYVAKDSKFVPLESRQGQLVVLGNVVARATG